LEVVLYGVRLVAECSESHVVRVSFSKTQYLGRPKTLEKPPPEEKAVTAPSGPTVPVRKCVAPTAHSKRERELGMGVGMEIGMGMGVLTRCDVGRSGGERGLELPAEVAAGAAVARREDDRNAARAELLHAPVRAHVLEHAQALAQVRDSVSVRHMQTGHQRATRTGTATDLELGRNGILVLDARLQLALVAVRDGVHQRAVRLVAGHKSEPRAPRADEDAPEKLDPAGEVAPEVERGSRIKVRGNCTGSTKYADKQTNKQRQKRDRVLLEPTPMMY
jgi:hypothetical protein